MWWWIWQPERGGVSAFVAAVQRRNALDMRWLGLRLVWSWQMLGGSYRVARLRAGQAKRSSGAEASVQETGMRNGAHGADKFGFKNLAGVHWNLPDTILVERAVRNGEGALVQGGAFCAETGVHTGRSPKDKHTVVDALTENTVWWDGNRKLSQANFQLLFDDMIAHARGKTLYVQDVYGGADPKYRIKTRVF